MTTTALTPSTPRERARVVRQLAARLGVTVTVSSGTCVSATVRFEPGDRAAYLAAEDACGRVLALLPMTYAGTVWGTDSGSVGGHAGLTGGYCRLSKSGIGRKLAAALVG